MNEVEKLYENAGIKANFCTYPRFCDENRCHECTLYDVTSVFTAEKQLELIKCLARKSHITIGLGLPWGQYDDDWWTVTRFGGGAGKDKYRFEEALADLVNDLWQDLTEEEKQQIKEILE